MPRRPSCPNCRGPLLAVQLDPDTPPYLCEACARGWWNAELDARAHWDPETRSFDDGEVLTRCERERAAQWDAVGDA